MGRLVLRLTMLKTCLKREGSTLRATFLGLAGLLVYVGCPSLAPLTKALCHCVGSTLCPFSVVSRCTLLCRGSYWSPLLLSDSQWTIALFFSGLKTALFDRGWLGALYKTAVIIKVAYS